MCIFVCFFLCLIGNKWKHFSKLAEAKEWQSHTGRADRKTNRERQDGSSRSESKQRTRHMHKTYDKCYNIGNMFGHTNTRTHTPTMCVCLFVCYLYAVNGLAHETNRSFESNKLREKSSTGTQTYTPTHMHTYTHLGSAY